MRTIVPKFASILYEQITQEVIFNFVTRNAKCVHENYRYIEKKKNCSKSSIKFIGNSATRLLGKTHIGESGHLARRQVPLKPPVCQLDSGIVLARQLPARVCRNAQQVCRVLCGHVQAVESQHHSVAGGKVRGPPVRTCACLQQRLHRSPIVGEPT